MNHRHESNKNRIEKASLTVVTGQGGAPSGVATSPSYPEPEGAPRLAHDNLIRQFLEAKRLEAEATARRVELGNAIAAELGTPEEGSKTHDVAGWRVTVKQSINRRVDLAVLDAIGLENPPLKIKRELDVDGLRWYQENEPETYLKIAKAITAAPGRVAIEVKESK
jgi:hypothetical protein